MFNPTKAAVRATVFDKDGQKAIRLKGKWNEGLYKIVSEDKLEILWTMREPPPNYVEYYGFTKFGIELNEITTVEQGFLPPTDSRLRPDLRLFEDGIITRANTLKLDFEETQRHTLKNTPERLVPKWFEKTVDPLSKEEVYKYNGEYWEKRESKSFDPNFALWKDDNLK